jgi:hypothetical protein
MSSTPRVWRQGEAPRLADLLLQVRQQAAHPVPWPRRRRPRGLTRRTPIDTDARGGTHRRRRAHEPNAGVPIVGKRGISIADRREKGAGYSARLGQIAR